MAIRKIHLAGHLLDPIYKGKFLKNNESIDATEFISNMAEHLQISIPDIMSELAEYRTNSGLWSKNFVWDSLKAKEQGFKKNKNKIGLLNTSGEDSCDFPDAVEEEEEEGKEEASIMYPSDNETDELFKAVNSYRCS